MQPSMQRLGCTFRTNTPTCKHKHRAAHTNTRSPRRRFPAGGVSEILFFRAHYDTAASCASVLVSVLRIVACVVSLPSRSLFLSFSLSLYLSFSLSRLVALQPVTLACSLAHTLGAAPHATTPQVVHKPIDHKQVYNAAYLILLVTVGAMHSVQ